MTRGRAVGFLIGLLVLSTGFADFRVFKLGSRQTGDERQTCKVQARGLKAAPHLTQSMLDISLLLARGDTNPQRLRGVPPKTLMELIDLQQQSQAYAQIESQQPKSRSC